MFLWMLRYQEALAVALARHQPDWASIAAALGNEGLLDRTGRLPTATVARKTWARVQQHIAAQTSETWASLAPSINEEGVRRIMGAIERPRP